MEVRGVAMDEMELAQEEDRVKKVRHSWKERRSRSTSNLVPSGGLSDSDGTGKEGNDSDDAERSLAKLTLQSSRAGGSRGVKSRSVIPNVVESDSVNELLLGTPHLKASQSSRRRRRYKRMAIEVSDSPPEPGQVVLFKEPHQLLPSMGIPSRSQLPGPSGASSSSSLVPPSTAHVKKGRKKSTPIAPFLSIDMDAGKRKRGHRDKSVEAGLATEFDSMIGMGIELMNIDKDEEMKSGEEDLSSSSGSESVIEASGDEGQEGDDEHSDWVGDEWMDDDSERRRDLIMRRLRDCAPSREFRAGRRRVHPTKPVFSIRTSANEQLAKFLQDPEQSQLKLHPMRREERVQLSHIASLYSLRMHYLRDGDSSETGGFTCPVLTKTPSTTQVTHDKLMEAIPVDPSVVVESESDSKRLKM